MFSKIKNFFFNAFREIFIYHHNSLLFRAKIFALLIAVNESNDECSFQHVFESGMKIYNDEDRVSALVLATKELVEKVHLDNGLDIDHLVDDIVDELKLFPRYSEKINIDLLKPILTCTHNRDTPLLSRKYTRIFTST